MSSRSLLNTLRKFKPLEINVQDMEALSEEGNIDCTPERTGKSFIEVKKTLDFQDKLETISNQSEAIYRQQTLETLSTTVCGSCKRNSDKSIVSALNSI